MDWSRLLFAAVVGIALGSGGCKKQADAGNHVALGEYASLTGATADFGNSAHNGLMLSVKQANAKGGVLGKQVKLIYEDDASDVNQALTVVQKLINREDVCAVIGEVASKLSLAGGSICTKYKTPMLSPASTNPDVTVENGTVKPYIFRICFTDEFQGGIDGKFAAEQGWKRVAVLVNRDEDYSKGLSRSFRQKFTAAGGEVVQDLEYGGGANDFKSLLSKIKDSHPDAVYVPGYYTEITLLLPQARQIELNVPFFGGDGWDSPQTRALPSANGCYYTDHFSADDPNPRVHDFVKAYQDANKGTTPDAMAALGYDSGGVMLKAIADAGSTDRQAIRAALEKIKDYPGVTGDITIDANHNARKPIVVLKIENGKAELVKTYDADGNPVPTTTPAN